MKKENVKKAEKKAAYECGNVVKIELLEGGIMPRKEFAESAGYDLFLPQRVQIGQGSGVIHLGFKLELPKGKAALLFARSGVAAKGVLAYLSESDGQLCNVKIVERVVDEEVINTLKETPNTYYIQDVREIESQVAGKKLYKCVYREKVLEPIRLQNVEVKLGMVDCGFRGEVGLIVKNNDPQVQSFFMEKGQSIGQMVIIDVPEVELVQAETLNDSEDGRGEQGFQG